jgi:uncharacterized protein YcbK (DUF882 family)
MTENEWKQLKYFHRKEAWGSPTNMDFRLLWLLDQVRKEIKFKFVIHEGFAINGHAPKSFHRKGMAVDFHVVGCSLYDAYKIFSGFWWFGGIGIYPYWNNPGIHLDLGPSIMWKYCHKIRRIWIRDQNKKYFYGIKNINKIML